MATAVIMPRQGNTVESCILLEWKKNKGDKINKGDIICEVETDKAVFEIEANDDGTILDIFFEEGDDIPVLTNIAVIGREGENYDDLKPDTSQSDESPSQEDTTADPQKETGNEQAPKAQPQTSLVKNSGSVGVSPRARRLAEKHALDTSHLQGSGPLGRVIERDVLRAIEEREPLTPAARAAALKTGAAVPVRGGGIGGRVTAADLSQAGRALITEDVYKDEPIKGVRKIISDRMLESLRNSAQLTLNSSAEASALLALRNTFKNSQLDTRFSEVNINDLVMFAVLKVLPKHPVINSLMLDDKIRYYENIHLGFAVDTPRGLMVPTIKNAQNYGLFDFSNEIKRLAYACRDNKIQLDELQGATFTITNLGGFGIDDFTPVLNLPQTAILGLSRINLKAVQAGDEVKFVPHIGLSLTINHQVIDGVAGAKFLQDLAQALKEINLIVAL